MRFALPTETFPIAVLIAGVVAALVREASGPFERGTLSRFRWTASLSATVVSALYVAFYLRGGPRIVDATSYFLEARAMSQGHLAWDVPDPEASVMGRFLARDTLGTGEHMGVIFPPGWPAVLAVGFWLGAPLAVGPVIAGVIVWLTISFTHRTAVRSGLDPFSAQTAARLAGALGVVCAALRYHTADTMAHGLAALCVLAAVSSASDVARPSGPSAPVRPMLVLGLSLGWLVATRPVSGAACAIVCLLAMGRLPRPRELLLGAAGLVPGVLLLIFHQRAVTGAWLVSSQSLYYLQSDHPEGCFRYGLGTEVGCLYEHGDFVRRYLPDGYDLRALAGTTLRRLQMHGVDTLNAEPLAIVLVLALWHAARTRGLRALACVLPAFALAYAPFYFDGNYPGGGARFFADALPVEHAMVALFVASVARSGRVRWVPRPSRSASILVGFCLIGFGVRAHVDHAHLRDREGGAPMFEPDLVRRAGITSALVFVDTDHGFSLGYDAEARADRGAVEIVRYHGDLADRLVFDARSSPASYQYDFDLRTGAVRIAPYVPAETARLEAETLWPALAQNNAAASPSHTSIACASGGRWLVLTSGAAKTRPSSIRLALPRALAGRRMRAWFGGSFLESWRVSVVTEGEMGVTPVVAFRDGPDLCAPTPWFSAPANAPLSLVLQMEPGGAEKVKGTIALDAIEVEPEDSSAN